MARIIGKLAATTVTALLKGGIKKSHPDGGNLYLQITGPGAGSWIFRYAEKGSGAQGKKPKTRWLGLGPNHTVSLSQAREKAKGLRQQLIDGLDPAAVRREARNASASALTFSEVADLYLAKEEPAWRSPIHARQWKASLRDYVTPVIGSMPVSAVETGDVMRVLESIWLRKTETASRVRQRIEAILDYAKTREWRTGENPARWKGHLSNLLVAKEKVAPVKHHAAMAWQAVPDFMASLGTRQGVAAAALAFLIHTATRSTEARGAVWGEIDLGAAIWTIPRSRMKAGKEHRIPLPAPAVAILTALKPEKPEADALVFPGAKEKKPLSDVALAKLLPPGVTCHGFRSSFRTWAGEVTGFPREVVEMALAHRLGDAVEQSYARGDLFQKRRRLMDSWGAYCSGEAPAADADNVVTFNAGAA